MSLDPGDELGPYRVAGRIGAGGMGEVYRATDTRLERDVAIKVLPEAFVADEERLARFEREAKLLASLNHPNVATVHGLEVAGSIHALVMELVEGPTLDEKLAARPMPASEVVEVFLPIASGLEAAHAKGIVHRDLKPANIKLTSNGAVKILDFGLATAFRATPEDDVSQSQSPTLTKNTALGVILGTAPYMSPEQARGQAVDERTDVWAFGCVLYEALTGRKAFAADTISDTIAAVIHLEPDWARLPNETPGFLRTLLRKCLQKDPRKRLHAIADARVELELGPSLDVRPAKERKAHRTASLVAAALAGAAAAAAVALLVPESSQPDASPVRSTLELTPESHLAESVQNPLTISPDGRHVVFAGGQRPGSHLFHRALDDSEPRRIEGSEGATAPFFSPDGAWIGFTVRNELRKLPLEGGLATVIGEAPPGVGASWGPEGDIILGGGRGGNTTGLTTVASGGGALETLTVPDASRGERSHSWPSHLPDGRRVLFTVLTRAGPRIALLTLETRAWQLLPPSVGGYQPRYLPTGHLVYSIDDTLLAAPFDLERLEGSSAPVSVVGGIERLITGAVFAISDLGSLVYEPPRGSSRLVWVDRAGRPTVLSAEPGFYAYPRLSPDVDGERLAVSLVEGWQTDVWLYDLSRGTRDRASYESGIYPVWTPDGSGLAFATSRSGTWNLASIPLDGTSQEIELLPPDADREEQLPTSWSPDGTVLLFARTDNKRGNRSYDIFTLSREGEVAPFLQTPFRETAARFSPDGAWVAYISDASGRDEVYVQAFPNGERRSVSTDGGTEPVWSRDGSELFYRRGDDMMVVAFRGEPLQIGTPRRLFTGRYATEPFNNIQNYDVAPDGQRFLMIEEDSGDDASQRLVLVQNWHGELARLVPVQ